MPSTELLLARIALLPVRVKHDSGLFDIRRIGALHALLFLVAFIGFVIWSQSTLLTIFALFVFTDVAYTAMFNSFYMDTAAILFLLMTTVCFVWLYRTRSRYWVAAYYLSALLLVAAKSQHCWLAIPLSIPPALLFWRRRVMVILYTVPLLLTASYMLVRTPADYAAQALWNSIFVKVLPMSTNARADLVQLGLDRRFQRFSGKSAYEFTSMQEAAFWNREFVRRATFQKLLLYYLKRPQLAAERLISSVHESWEMRPPYLGNFGRTTGLAPFAKSKAFAFWSDFKRWVGTDYPSIAGALLVLAAVVIALATRFVSFGFAFAWVIAGTSFGEFLLGAFADGIDFGRHLLLAQALLDMYCCFFVVASAALVSTVVVGHWRRSKVHVSGWADETAGHASGTLYRRLPWVSHSRKTTTGLIRRLQKAR